MPACLLEFDGPCPGQIGTSRCRGTFIEHCRDGGFAGTKLRFDNCLLQGMVCAESDDTAECQPAETAAPAPEA